MHAWPISALFSALGLSNSGFLALGAGIQVDGGACGQFSKLGSLLGSLFTRVPYYVGDPKRDPHLENYPCGDLGLQPSEWALAADLRT